MRSNFCVILVLITSFAEYSDGSQPCVCVNSQDTPVYKEIWNVIGYLYQYDCEPLIDPSSVNDRQTGYYAIHFNGEIGLIENNPGDITIDKCPGASSIVTSTTTPTTTRSTTRTPDVVTPTTVTTTTDVTSTKTDNVRTTIAPTSVHQTKMTSTTSATNTVPTKPQMTTTTQMPMTFSTKTSDPMTTKQPSSTPLPTKTTILTTLRSSTTLPTTSAIRLTLTSSSSRPTTSTMRTTLTSSSSLPTTTFATTTVTQFPYPPCPEGWKQYKASCYMINLRTRVKYEAARDSCSLLQSHLLFINSREEQEIISLMLNSNAEYNNMINVNTRRNATIWTGGIRQQNEQVWRWSNPLTHKTQPIDYTNWGDTYPRHPSTSQDACIGIASGWLHKWHDNFCTNELYYICERTSFSLPGLIG